MLVTRSLKVDNARLYQMKFDMPAFAEDNTTSDDDGNYKIRVMVFSRL